jgi:murein DD-endopeptidase MepM/ murein hydrolase activator NlpD
MGQKIPTGGHVLDLAIGESADVVLGDGARHAVKLVGLTEPRCKARGIIRFPVAHVEVDGEPVDLTAALYHMPTVLKGLRIGCAVTRGVSDALASFRDVFALEKDARIRVWDAAGPLFHETPIVYPARQAWFASMTQMANEKTHVDAGEAFLVNEKRHVYHHFGMDFGGYEYAVPVVAARSGQVVVRGEETVAGYDPETGGALRYDRVVVRDDEDWYFLYSHLTMIDAGVRLGERVEAGEAIGLLGKEGSSGGWSHLHFGMRSVQPNGRYGEVEGYPFLVEAYLNEHPGSLLACARPHLVGLVGEPVTLEAGRSISDGSDIVSHRWKLHTGEEVEAMETTLSYEREGIYSEMLTVEDAHGQTDVDFCVVQIVPQDGDPARTPPGIHLAHFPTEGIRPGQPVAFKVRCFFKGPFAGNAGGEDEWDFGDGTTTVSWSDSPARGAASTDTDYAERWHAFEHPGRYIVTVRRTGANGVSSTAQIKVDVG